MFRAISLVITVAAQLSCVWAQGWIQQTSNTTWALYGVSASSPSTATAAGYDSGIRRTTDAGETWAPQTVGPGQIFLCVSFADENNGVIGGHGGTVLFTTDGGTTWTPEQTGDFVSYYAAHQISPQWSIVGGVDSTQTPLVSVTTSGWQTYDNYTFHPFHNGSDWEGTINGLDFVTADIGFAAIWIFDGQGAICRTTDGGATWETVYWSPTGFLDLDFPISDAGMNGYAVGGDGLSVRTQNGGLTWEARPTGVSQHLYSVSFADPVEGWAVGGGGTIVHTTDGGETWDVQESPVTDDLYSVSFANSDTGYVVGDNGTILFTPNGGAAPNQPPGAFWRVSPQDSVVVDTSELVLEVPLVWTASVDPDGDAVSYTVHFWSNDWDCIVENNYSTWDTIVTAQVCVPVSPLDELYHFHWRVFARDGQDSVEASNGEGMFLLDLPASANEPGEVPHEYSLSAYPNPFNSTTTLHLSLPVSSEAVLRVFDVAGRLAKEIRLGMLTSGSHEISFDGSDLPSGIYLAVMETPHIRLTQKLVLLK